MCPWWKWSSRARSFRVQCLDWTGGQILAKNDDSANDIRDVDLTQVHYLSGPIGVEGAEPGDLLVVDILDIGTLAESEWGFTGLFAQEQWRRLSHRPLSRRAQGLLGFPGHFYAQSRHIPGVRFAGLMHPGLIGCLPSADLLKTGMRTSGKPH
ncbi:MAG: acetamidase/formamidase family protein [Candidatus Manganitrophus sp.]|nr:acetamidase/formamidase family protein [Candidatus Manganitrophus sp.]